MVDKTLVAAKIATVRDAVARVREVLPADVDVFLGDRAAREIVVLNVFVALQDCLSLATHWLADEGRTVPESYGDVLRALGDRGVIPSELARRLAAASGFRNLVAHRYGALAAWGTFEGTSNGSTGRTMRAIRTISSRSAARYAR